MLKGEFGKEKKEHNWWGKEREGGRTKRKRERGVMSMIEWIEMEVCF